MGLPKDVLMVIFGNLKLRELGAPMRVCREWNAFIVDGIKAVNFMANVVRSAILEKIKRSNLHYIDKDHQIVELVSIYEKTGRVDQGLSFLLSLSTWYQKRCGFSALCRSLAERGNFREAKKIAKLMPPLLAVEQSEDDVSYHTDCLFDLLDDLEKGIEPKVCFLKCRIRRDRIKRCSSWECIEKIFEKEEKKAMEETGKLGDSYEADVIIEEILFRIALRDGGKEAKRVLLQFIEDPEWQQELLETIPGRLAEQGAFLESAKMIQELEGRGKMKALLNLFEKILMSRKEG